MMSKTEIHKVNAQQIRSLRHSELRKGEDFSTTSYLRDDDNETFHMACVKEDKIVVCATFYPEFCRRIQAKNAYRLSPYHRLDISLTKSKLSDSAQRDWIFSAYNVYNNVNPFFALIREDENGNTVLREFGLFPIIPSIAWRFKF